MSLMVFGRPAHFATLAYRQPLLRFHLIWPTNPTGRCPTGSYEHKCGACMMVLQHIFAVLCKMFSITPTINDGQVKEDILHGLHSHRIWILWTFTCKDIYKPLCMQLLFTTNRHFTIALWMPIRLSPTALASLNRNGDRWWDLSRRALNLMEDILSTYYNYKCTLFSYNLLAYLQSWALLEKLPTVQLGPLSPQHGTSSGCGWRRQPPDMKGSRKYIE
jgi:hypothetical protein